MLRVTQRNLLRCRHRKKGVDDGFVIRQYSTRRACVRWLREDEKTLVTYTNYTLSSTVRDNPDRLWDLDAGSLAQTTTDTARQHMGLFQHAYADRNVL